MFLDLFKKRKEPQGNMTATIRHEKAKLVIGELLALGSQIDGIIAVVSIDRLPRILVGGIDNVYEASGLLDSAKFEIFTKGLPVDD